MIIPLKVSTDLWEIESDVLGHRLCVVKKVDIAANCNDCIHFLLAEPQTGTDFKAFSHLVHVAMVIVKSGALRVPVAACARGQGIQFAMSPLGCCSL